MVTRCQALISGFEKLEARIELNRDACALDVTSEEARQRKMVAGNEAFIGRRVIAANIKRELPVFIQYLAGSFRHVSIRGRYDTVPANICAQLETEFTNAFRQGNWLATHLQVISSMELHGRGVFLVVPSTDNPLGIQAAYVPPEDFIFPAEVRDIQAAPMLAIAYQLTSTQFEAWAQIYSWRADAYREIFNNLTDDDNVKRQFRVFRVLYRHQGAIYACWYLHENLKLLTAPELFNTGFYNPDGSVMPRDTYPVFPVYYNVTESPAVAERLGRAHEDMHDQEALTLLVTSVVNGSIRSSELYIADLEQGVSESPEVVQTSFVIEPGKVTKRKLQFYSPPAPDSSLLITAQALRSENASAAGQVDFAAQARKDSRKTAKELSLAEQQTSQVQTVPLTSFASDYRRLLQYVWDVVANNVAVGINTDFAQGNEVLRTTIAAVEFLISPSGDVDYLERQQKLQSLTQFYPLFATTAAGPFFLQKILELAFPNEYTQIAPLLTDNSKQMGAALYKIVEAIPPNLLPPDMQPKMAEIMAAAGKAFNVAPETGAQGAAGPAMG